MPNPVDNNVSGVSANSARSGANELTHRSGGGRSESGQTGPTVGHDDTAQFTATATALNRQANVSFSPVLNTQEEAMQLARSVAAQMIADGNAAIAAQSGGSLQHLSQLL